MQPAISIVGTGKVGSTLARLLYKAGYRVVSVYNRTPEKAEPLVQDTGAKLLESPANAVDDADIIFLTVADDAIETVADEMVHLNWQNKAIVHTSGAASIDKLEVLAQSGAMTGSLHPAFPFADVTLAMENLAGASFAIETAYPLLEQWLRDIVSALEGQVILIPPGKKAQYHAALVFASNYTVSLYAIARQLLEDLDAESDAIDNALIVLLQATVDNIRKQGIPDALTGPLSRGDIGTIDSHLDALNDDNIKHTYIALARLSYPMLEQRGINTHIIEEWLQEKL